MASPALPLQDIVNVSVSVSPVNPAQPSFNQALIVGPTPAITKAQRLALYTSPAGLLAAGYITSSPEYIAAQLYYGGAQPPRFLWVGLQDLTAIQTAVVTPSSEGTGYLIGDLLAIVQGSASGGVAVVTAVSGGAVTAVSLSAVGGSTGTGYSVANGLATTGGHGSGAEINITAIGETPLQAVQACRNAQSAWYAVMVTDAVDADHLAIAAYAQTATTPVAYFITTQDAAVLNNTAGNICAQMQALLYKRVFTLYSTTQGGLAPANIYAVASVMGVAMGLNTGLANSYFNLMFKQLVGVLPEPLTQNQVDVLSGIPGVSFGINCNVYVGYANSYSWLQQGTMANGQFFDEVLGLDMLASGIQFDVANVLQSQPSVPQTDAGQTLLIHAVNQACDAAVTRGFLAGGTWKGVQILNLFAGQALPSGYLTQSPPYNTQSSADRTLRKSMPIYTAAIEAGAAQSVTIGVFVQR